MDNFNRASYFTINNVNSFYKSASNYGIDRDALCEEVVVGGYSAWQEHIASLEGSETTNETIALGELLLAAINAVDLGL